MRYGIVSDVHGNLEALNAVLEDFDRVDAVISPGDVVGYGADPDACCDIIRNRSRSTVMGNHDAAVTGQMDVSWFNPAARRAVRWTQDHTSPQNLEYLKNLPSIATPNGFKLVHGSPVNPLDFEYIVSPWEARPALMEMTDVVLCFIGHSHIAEYYLLEEGFISPLKFSLINGGLVQLKPEIKYIINCGSVGQPRDGNPLASYGVYDTESQTVEVRRVSYDLETAQNKIRNAGLPEPLAERLAYGY